MKKVFLWSILAFLLFLPFSFVIGGDDIDEVPEYIPDKEAIINLLDSLLVWIWGAMLIIVVMIFLYIGFQFVTASGNPDKIENAKKMLKWGLVGVVVMVLSGGIVYLIINILEEGAS